MQTLQFFIPETRTPAVDPKSTSSPDHSREPSYSVGWQANDEIPAMKPPITRKTSRRIENRAYSDAHFMLVGFSMVRNCHWHCSETTIFSIIIFVQQDKTVLKLVTNFDTCLCFASAKRVFFARDLRRQKFAGCIFKLPVEISLLSSLL